MFLIQLALTLVIVHIVTANRLAAALSIQSILSGRTQSFPVWTARIQTYSFWGAIVVGLAAIWSL